MERRAYDGKLEQTAYWDPNGAGMRYLPPTGDNATWGPDRAYVPYGGYYTGVSFNPRGIYYPASVTSNSFEETIRGGAKRGVLYALEGDPAKDDSVVLVGKYKDGESRWYVDVQAGFVITRQESRRGGKATLQSLRRYTKDAKSGATVLTSYTEPGLNGAKPRLQIDLRYASVNEPVPEEVFTREGMTRTLDDFYPASLKADPDLDSWLHLTADKDESIGGDVPPASALGRAGPSGQSTTDHSCRPSSSNCPLSTRCARAPDTDFAEVERRCNDLLKRYPAPEDQGKIYYELAQVEGQSGMQHPDKLIQYAQKALALPCPPREAGRPLRILGRGRAGRPPGGAGRRNSAARGGRPPCSTCSASR